MRKKRASGVGYWTLRLSDVALFAAVSFSSSSREFEEVGALDVPSIARLSLSSWEEDEVGVLSDASPAGTLTFFRRHDQAMCS